MSMIDRSVNQLFFFAFVMTFFRFGFLRFAAGLACRVALARMASAADCDMPCLRAIDADALSNPGCALLIISPHLLKLLAQRNIP